MHQHTLLVSADWLNERVNADAIAILDLRASSAYAKGHLPKAQSFSLPHCQSAGESLPQGIDADAVAIQLGALGISPADTVVLYDEGLSHNATLGFWALEHAGQAHVCILEGGLKGWTASGHTLTANPTPCTPKQYRPTLRPTRTYAADVTADHSARLLDVRGVQEYRAAHIEGATHCCWTELVQDLQTLTLLPDDTIIAKLNALGLSTDDDIITYCRSGARGSFVYFVLRLLGWSQVRLYDGSMNDWLLRENPVVAQ